MLNEKQQSQDWNYWLFAILAVVILPLTHSEKTVDITLVPQFFLFTLLTAASLLIFFIFQKRKHFTFYLSPFYLLLTAYFVVCSTSLIGAVNVHEGGYELFKTGSWIVFVIVSIELFQSKSAVNSVFKAFSVSSFILALIGLGQITGMAFTDLPGHVIPYGTLGNRNIYTASLLMTLPFTLYEVLTPSNKFWRLFAALSALLNVSVIAAGGMRTALIALFLALVFCSLILIFKYKAFRFNFSERIIKTAKILIVISIVGGAAGTGAVLTSAKGKAIVKRILNTESANERIALWRNSIYMFKDHPVNGAGAGNWKIVQPKYGLSKLPPEARRGEMHYQRPENDFLWILAETGIIGFLCYIGIFGTAFFMAFRQLASGADHHHKIRMLCMIAGLVMYSVIAFWGFPKERTFLSLELAFILAVIAAGYQFSSARKFKIHTFILVAIFGYFVYEAYCWNEGELITKKIIDARKANLHDEVIQLADEAVKYDYLMDPTSTPIKFYRGTANFSLNRIDDAFNDFKEAEKIHPHHLHVLNNLAACYETKGERSQAIEYLNKALRISPAFNDAVVSLAAIHFNQGNTAKADELISRPRLEVTPYFLEVQKAIDKRINDSLMTLASNFFNAGDYRRADELLAKCRRNAKDTAFISLRKAVYLKKRDVERKNAK